MEKKDFIMSFPVEDVHYIDFIASDIRVVIESSHLKLLWTIFHFVMICLQHYIYSQLQIEFGEKIYFECN